MIYIPRWKVENYFKVGSANYFEGMLMLLFYMGSFGIAQKISFFIITITSFN